MISRPLRDRALGIRLLFAYKVVRGVLVIALSVTLAIAIVTGEDVVLREVAGALDEHLAGAWASTLSDFLVRISSARSLKFGSIAFACDGTFTLFEAWALWRGFSWAPWLVVIATASFLPFEIFEIYRGLHVGRVVIFVVNVAVVVYLVRRRARET